MSRKKNEDKDMKSSYPYTSENNLAFRFQESPEKLSSNPAVSGKQIGLLVNLG